MEQFETRIELPCDVATAFDFVIRPANIRKISPPAMGLFFTASPDRYALGARIEFKVQAYGLVREVVHTVTAFEESRLLIEEQSSGPFQAWVHEHLFETRSDGGSVVIDRIRFKPPGGVAGLVLTASRILDNLEEGFDYRHDQLEKEFGRVRS